MEADWEVDIGPESPVIDVAWPGFVDLQQDRSRIDEISEATRFPHLAAALLRLNAKTAFSDDTVLVLLQTVKCDLWLTGPCDPFEMEATPETSLCGTACYIDLVPRQCGLFATLPTVELWARRATERLRSQSFPASRVDLVIRQAITAVGTGFGITAYISACGATTADSEERLGEALDVFAKTVVSLERSIFDPTRAASAECENDTIAIAGE